MSARTQRLRAIIHDGQGQWRSRAINPYIISYRMAFGGFTKTMQAQADADKARAELFVSMASIVGGSLLMATVGQTSLRAVAGNAALNFICNRNLDRTFNAMAVAAENKTFMFALGKTLDTIKDQIGKRVKDEVTEIIKSKEIKTSDPLDKYLEFDSLMLNHEYAANHAAEQIEADRKMDDAKKHAAFVALEAAPICKPPSGVIDPNLLGPKIELGIYLSKVMESAELDTWGPSYGGFGGGQQRPISVKPITQRPSAPDFPKPVFNRDGSGQSVGYNMTGDPFQGTDAVRARIDELHKQVFKEAFYPSRGFFDRYMAEEKRAELVKAETQLDRLGQDVRPLSLLGLRT